MASNEITMFFFSVSIRRVKSSFVVENQTENARHSTYSVAVYDVHTLLWYTENEMKREGKRNKLEEKMEIFNGTREKKNERFFLSLLSSPQVWKCHFRSFACSLCFESCVHFALAFRMFEKICSFLLHNHCWLWFYLNFHGFVWKSANKSVCGMINKAENARWVLMCDKANFSLSHISLRRIRPKKCVWYAFFPCFNVHLSKFQSMVAIYEFQVEISAEKKILNKRDKIFTW